MMDSPTFEPYRVDPAKYRYFFDHQLQASEEDKELLRRALDAWQRATERDGIEPDDLALLVSAATHRRAAVWDSSVALFCSLIGKFPTAKDAAREIMRTGKAAERWHLLQGLDFCSDRAFVIETVDRAIDDSAPTVRMVAGLNCNDLDLMNLVPRLVDRSKIERSPKVRQRLDRYRALMQDGYYVTPTSEPNEYSIWVRVAPGHESGCFITADDLQPERLAAIVKKLQKKT